MDGGERRLCLALLRDAICRAAHAAARRRTGGDVPSIEAERWLADDATSWPFSYRNVCAYLGLDPDALRPILARLFADGVSVAQIARTLKPPVARWTVAGTAQAARRRRDRWTPEKRDAMAAHMRAIHAEAARRLPDGYGQARRRGIHLGPVGATSHARRS